MSQLKGWVTRNKVLWCLLLLAHFGSLAALRSGYMNKFSVLTFLLTVVVLVTVGVFWVVNKLFPQSENGVEWTPEELYKRGYLVHTPKSLKRVSLVDSEAATLAGSMKRVEPVKQDKIAQPYNQSTEDRKTDRVPVGTEAHYQAHGGAKILEGVGHLDIPRELV